jgi:hypothetical protein
MSLFEQLEKRELKNLLNRNWITHDAMWFYNCLRECGIEKTNKINKAAVRAMATVEVKRLKKAFGFGSDISFDELKRLLLEGFELINGGFMDFRMSFPEKNVFQWDIPKCFAHDGIKGIGAIEGYNCGIVDRPCGWFDGLGIGYTMEPKIEGCLMHKRGNCSITFTFDLKK